jgi:hypothetical protein
MRWYRGCWHCVVFRVRRRWKRLYSRHCVEIGFGGDVSGLFVSSALDFLPGHSSTEVGAVSKKELVILKEKSEGILVLGQKFEICKSM